MRAALTADSAAALYEPGLYDLVICDINLGGVDGLSVARDFRGREPLLRIIIVSGVPDNLERARRAGFSRRLKKPFDPDDLYAFLDD